jgi:hypothetical protein
MLGGVTGCFRSGHRWVVDGNVTPNGGRYSMQHLCSETPPPYGAGGAIGGVVYQAERSREWKGIA